MSKDNGHVASWYDVVLHQCRRPADHNPPCRCACGVVHHPPKQ